VAAGGNLTVSNLTFTGGSGDYGGSIRSLGALSISGCTFTGNHATQDGGAVHGDTGSSSLLVANSTLTGNSCDVNSGALATGAQQNTLDHLTITGNTAPDGTGVAMSLYQYPATMLNCIVAGNTPDGVLSLAGGVFTAQSVNNLVGAGGAGGLLDGVNGNHINLVAVTNIVTRTNLSTQVVFMRTNVVTVSQRIGFAGPLASNGGPTPTMAIQPGGLAVDKGATSDGVTTDQRGVARDPYPDIGAFEYVYPRLIPPTNNVSVIGIYGPDYRLTYLGVPFTQYILEHTYNLNPANWVPVDTNASMEDGTLDFITVPTPGTNSYWRISTQVN
jgi:predicted outer membrane repeat protein